MVLKDKFLHTKAHFHEKIFFVRDYIFFCVTGSLLEHMRSTQSIWRDVDSSDDVHLFEDGQQFFLADISLTSLQNPFFNNAYTMVKTI